MKLTGLSASLGRWLDGSGPASDVVLSTRVRLARNLAGVPVTHRAREEQLAMVYSSVLSAVRKTPAALPAMRHPHFGAIVNGGTLSAATQETSGFVLGLSTKACITFWAHSDVRST